MYFQRTAKRKSTFIATSQQTFSPIYAHYLFYIPLKIKLLHNTNVVIICCLFSYTQILQIEMKVSVNIEVFCCVFL